MRCDWNLTSDQLPELKMAQGMMVVTPNAWRVERVLKCNGSRDNLLQNLLHFLATQKMLISSLPFLPGKSQWESSAVKNR